VYADASDLHRPAELQGDLVDRLVSGFRNKYDAEEQEADEQAHEDEERVRMTVLAEMFEAHGDDEHAQPIAPTAHHHCLRARLLPKHLGRDHHRDGSETDREGDDEDDHAGDGQSLHTLVVLRVDDGHGEYGQVDDHQCHRKEEKLASTDDLHERHGGDGHDHEDGGHSDHGVLDLILPYSGAVKDRTGVHDEGDDAGKLLHSLQAAGD